MLQGMLILGALFLTQTAYAEDVSTTKSTAATPAASTATPTQNAPASTSSTAPAAASSSTTTPATSQTATGAYQTVDVADASVKNAAAFAVSQMQQGTLVKVESAQVQVVAGLNYKMLLTLDQNGTQNQYTVVVYAPLPTSNQPMQLTSVQAMGAAPAASATQ